MIDFGTVRPGTTLYIPFATYDSNDPSASVTLTGLATTDIEVYKNGSVTQRSSDSGYALLDSDGIDFDLTTGIHGFSIDLADNTDAGFWAAGAQYTVVVASITVDAATINFIAATFRIGYPTALFNTTVSSVGSQTSMVLSSGPAEDDALNGYEILFHDVASAVQVGRAVISDYTGSTKTITLAAATTFTVAATDNVAILGPSPLMPTTAGRTLDVSSTGEAGLDWANVGSPTTSVALSGTTISTSQAVASVSGSVASVTGAVGSVTGNVGGNVVGSVASVTAGVTLANGAITDASLAGNMEIVFETDFATNYNATRNAWVTNAQDFVGTTAGDPFNGTVVSASVTGNVGGNVSGSVGSVTGGINTGAGVITTLDGLDTAQDTQHSTTQGLIGTPIDFGSGTSTLAANLQDIADNGTATFDRSTDSLQAIRDRGDAAWTTGGGADNWVIASGTIGATGNTTTTLHLTGLTFGDDELNDLLIRIYDNSAGEYHSRWILDWADTGDLATVALLPFTPEDSVDTYVVLSARQDVTGGSGLDAAGVRSAIGLASANLDTQLSTIDGVVDSILVDTAEIGAAGAGLTEAGGTGDQLTAVPWNAAWDAEVQSEVQDAIEVNRLDHLVAVADVDEPVDNSIIAKLADSAGDWSSFSAGTHSLKAIQALSSTISSGVTTIASDTAEIGVAGAGLTDLGGMSTAMKAEVNTEVDGAIETYHLQYLLAVDYDPASPPGVSTALLNEIIESDAGVSRFTTNALENAPSGGGGGDATAANQATIIAAIGTMTDLGGGADIANNLADIAGVTFSSATDSLESIRNRGDAAWSAAASSPLLLQNTTIATLASQTSFTLTAGSTDDDAYNGHMIVVTDSATSTQKAVGKIGDYVGSSKTVTLIDDPGIFTMAVGDTVDIITSPVTPFVADRIHEQRTWLVRDGDEGLESSAILTLPAAFAGTLAFDFSQILNEDTCLSTLSSVADDDGDATIVFKNLRLDGSKTFAMFDVAGLTNATDYRVRATATTTDSQTLPVVGVLKCRDNP